MCVYIYIYIYYVIHTCLPYESTLVWRTRTHVKPEVQSPNLEAHAARARALPSLNSPVFSVCVCVRVCVCVFIGGYPFQIERKPKENQPMFEKDKKEKKKKLDFETSAVIKIQDLVARSPFPTFHQAFLRAHVPIFFLGRLACLASSLSRLACRLLESRAFWGGCCGNPPRSFKTRQKGRCTLIDKGKYIKERLGNLKPSVTYAYPRTVKPYSFLALSAPSAV